MKKCHYFWSWYELIREKIEILNKGPTQKLDDTTLTPTDTYPINFRQPNKRFVLNLHYSGSNSFFIVNVTKTYKFKTKNLK